MLGQQLPPQHQQQPYRYGMPPSSTPNQPLLSNRPTNFNPNELPPHQQQPNQFNTSGSISHPPSSYPTPSSTPANVFSPPQITSPPGPPQVNKHFFLNLIKILMFFFLLIFFLI